MTKPYGDVSIEVKDGKIFLIAESSEQTVRYLISEMFALELGHKLRVAPDTARRQLAEKYVH